MPELLGGGAPRRGERDALTGAQPLERLERTKVGERVGDDVAVDAGAEASAGGAKRSEIGETVSEVGLGRRAHAREGASTAEQLGLGRGEMRGVDGDERLESTPRSARSSTGRLPVSSTHSATSRGCSATCMWSGSRCRAA